ncbi:hypothetical protein V8F20_001448 [Naviculisporaceae sp. PSN 640]
MNSKLVNVSLSIGLVAVFVTCYVLLIILFVNASALHLDSLVVVQNWLLTPYVVVNVVTTLLASAALAFAIECVDHALWLNHLNPINGVGLARNPVTVKETSRLAQWTVSALGRLNYIIFGRSYALKFGGLLLLAATIAPGPVLQAGISQKDKTSSQTLITPHSVDVWTPWITLGNSQYRAGSATDLPLYSAALASNQNLELPVTQVCSNNTCSVTTRSAALFAQCTSRTLANTEQRMGRTSCSNTYESQVPLVENYCSTITPSLCANLTCGDPAVYANFLTGPDPSCEQTSGDYLANSTCNTLPGTWATIFAVWVGGTDSLSKKGNPNIVNLVDCSIEYGNVTLSQKGAAPPTIDRSTFEKSQYLLSGYSSNIANVRQYVWHQAVNEATKNTPYDFTLRLGSTGWNAMYLSAAAEGLLGEGASNNAEYVARQIERNFDWATLAAFAREPNASDITRTITTTTRVYVFRPANLAILIVPLLGTLLACWGRLRVGSREEVPGYDPVAIARRGRALMGGDTGYEKYTLLHVADTRI